MPQYWTREIIVTQRIDAAKLAQHMPDWCFDHITRIEVISDNFRCMMYRKRGVWLGGMSWSQRSSWHVNPGKSYFVMARLSCCDPGCRTVRLTAEEFNWLQVAEVEQMCPTSGVFSELTVPRLIYVLKNGCELALQYGEAAGSETP